MRCPVCDDKVGYTGMLTVLFNETVELLVHRRCVEDEEAMWHLARILRDAGDQEFDPDVTEPDVEYDIDAVVQRRLERSSGIYDGPRAHDL